jgi:8-oxo-dGTP diphosphatase
LLPCYFATEIRQTMNNPINRFNIRVYGILIDSGRILVTDEFRLGMKMTKFPGGGLQFGEGTADCLKREFMEEMNQKIKIINHFYTTDYFQQSKFLSPSVQVINIYYFVKAVKPFVFKTTKKKFDFEEVDGAQTFRWINRKELKPAEMTLPIDKKVAGLLMKL